MADLLSGEHRGFAALHAEGWPFDRGRRVGLKKAAGDQPIEQAAERGQMQLHRGALMALAEIFDIGGHMQGAQCCKRLDPDLIAPREKPHGGAMIGASGVRVSDGGNEKLNKPFRSAAASGLDLLRQGQGVLIGVE